MSDTRPGANKGWISKAACLLIATYGRFSLSISIPLSSKYYQSSFLLDDVMRESLTYKPVTELRNLCITSVM